MSEADAEDRDVGFEQTFQVLNDFDVFRRVAGSVGQHDAVKLACDLLRRGERWDGDDLAAALLQLTLDIVLDAVVIQRDAVFHFTLSRVDAAFVAGDRFDRVLDEICLHLLDGLFVRLTAFGINDAVHNARVPELAGKPAGVDARQADDLLFLEVFVQRQLAAPVGREFRDLAHDKAGYPALAGLVILEVNAVVADQRVGHGDDLAVVGGVGQDLLIAGHAGVENDLADALPFVADGVALKQGAVRQKQISSFHIISPVLYHTN